jgi:hypothetical protein
VHEQLLSSLDIILAVLKNDTRILSDVGMLVYIDKVIDVTSNKLDYSLWSPSSTSPSANLFSLAESKAVTSLLSFMKDLRASARDSFRRHYGDDALTKASCKCGAHRSCTLPDLSP